MIELKPCPFCGDEAEQKYRSDFVYQVGCSNHKCAAYVFNRPKHIKASDSIKEWNTRAERTCHNEATEPGIIFSCSECNADFINEPIDGALYYCPNCGAKVVEQ